MTETPAHTELERVHMPLKKIVTAAASSLALALAVAPVAGAATVHHHLRPGAAVTAGHVAVHVDPWARTIGRPTSGLDGSNY